MYDLTPSIACLKSTVGYQQNDNQRFPTIAPDLVTSETGVEVDHPLVTVEYIWNSLNNTDPAYYPEWNAGDTYELGQRVKITATGIEGPTSFTIYESQINGNIGNDPTSSADWDEIDLIDEYLDQVKEDAIRDVLRDLYKKKKLDQEVKNLIQDVKLYRKASRIYNKEIKSNRFVGFEIQVKNSDYLTVIIERIGVQFSETNTDLPLYLYHSSIEQPIATILVSNTSPNDFQWTVLDDTILRFNDENHDIGGVFFIGYKESELTGQAIIRDRDMSVPPCGSCDRREYQDYLAMNPFIGVMPFYVPESELGASNEIWDIANTRYVYNKNWGLNFDFSVKCDVSQLFCKNKFALAEAIRVGIERKIIRMMKLNTRNNEVAQRVKMLSADELDGKDNTNNVEMQYKYIMKALDFDMSAFQSACAPCKNNGSRVTYGSV